MKLTFLTFYSLILGKTILNSSKIEVKPGIKNKGTDKKKQQDVSASYLVYQMFIVVVKFDGNQS